MSALSLHDALPIWAGEALSHRRARAPHGLEPTGIAARIEADWQAGGGSRSEGHTSELQSPTCPLFPYTTLFRSGPVKRFPIGARVPHMGWNQLELRREPKLIGKPEAAPDRKGTRLNSSHRHVRSFPTRRSSDLGR